MLSNRKHKDIQLYYSPETKNFIYNISIMEKSLSNDNKSSTTLLKNDDIKDGTYRIISSGKYKLSEDIIFNPNPGIKNDINLDDWNPRYPSQLLSYPPDKYGLGFFAAITIEADNVILDLNGYTIRQSKEHYLQQRFFSLIELANQPFIPKSDNTSTQGPANFGTSFIAPNNVKICNGYLGLSSHHGIHGNAMKNIVLEDLTISNFEIAGIALNGGENMLLKNVKVIRTNNKVPIASTYSASRFIRRFLKKIADDTNNTYNIGKQVVTANILLTNLVREMDNTFDQYMNNKNITSSLYKNVDKVADGAVYGIVFNQNGVVVGPFLEERKEQEGNNQNIILCNVQIDNIESSPVEVIGLSVESSGNNINDFDYGLKMQVGSVGEVFRIKNVQDIYGKYKHDVLSQAHLYLTKHSLQTNKSIGTLNISQKIIDWSNNSTNFDTVLNDNLYYVGGGDSMAHAMKGNIGLFLSGVKTLQSKNVYINRIINSGKESIYKLREGISHEYIGNMSRGIVITGSQDIQIHTEISDIISKTSCVCGIDIIGKSSDIDINAKIGCLECSSQDFGKPNLLCKVMNIQVSEESENIKIH